MSEVELRDDVATDRRDHISARLTAFVGLNVASVGQLTSLVAPVSWPRYYDCT
jgi:hypothetical protein